MTEPPAPAGLAIMGDHHLHTQFSWDAERGDMEGSCRRALELGLRSIAFTDHADFVTGVHPTMTRLDVPAYRAEVDRCRFLFPGLRILCGVELGEPHAHVHETAEVLANLRPDRVLGSVHCFEWRGRLIDASQIPGLAADEAAGAALAYFSELLGLLESEQPFEVVAHLEYVKRYWHRAAPPYRPGDFEEPVRAILRAAVGRGAVLEVNTTRGADPARGLSPDPEVLGWWVEAGGRAVSFGSDAHDPALVARGFGVARAMVEAAGFRPNDDPAGHWLR